MLIRDSQRVHVMDLTPCAGQAAEIKRKDEDKEEFDEEEGWCEHYAITEVFPDEILFAIFSYLDWQDLVRLGQTCVTLMDFCSDSRLWAQLWNLDFSRCSAPSHQRVLEIAKRCPSARVFRLDVNLNDNQFFEILDVCPRLHTFELKKATEFGNGSLHRIADKCGGVKSLKVSGSSAMDTVGVEEVVRAHPGMEELYLNQCDIVRYLQLRQRHGDATVLCLTKITIKNMHFVEDNLETLCANCPAVRELCLSGSSLPHFSMDEVGSGLLQLQTLDLTDCDLLEYVRLEGLLELGILYCGNCTMLVEVTVDCTKLKQVLVSGCNTLKIFQVASEEIEILDLSTLPRLDTLSLHCPTLSDLDVSASSRIPVVVLNSLVRQLPKLQKLNVRSCKQFCQKDLERLVASAKYLSTLHCGGMALEDFVFSSLRISSLSLESIYELGFVAFSSPALHQLTLHNCSDINEEQLIEGIVYGDRVRKTPGPSSVRHKIPQKLGAPLLMDLTLSHVPNVIGKALSQLGSNMTSLRTLTVKDSFFFKELLLNGWLSLETVRIIAGTRFNSLNVQHCPNLKQIAVLYCSDVSEVDIDAKSLETFDTDGSSFSNLKLSSDQLTALALDSVMASANSTLEVKCPNLRQLKMTRCRELGAEHINRIAFHSSYLTELAIEGSNRITSIDVPETVTSLELHGLRRLTDIQLHTKAQINVLHLCGLPKLSEEMRHHILELASPRMRELKISGVPKAKEMILAFEHIESLQVDQIISLTQLTVICPKLHFLSLQGCPRLTTLKLQVEKLHQLRVASRSLAIQSLRKLHLLSNTARFLSRILEQYCPRIVELTLTGALVSAMRLRGASRQLRYLKTIHLDECKLEANDQDGTNYSNGFKIHREPLDSQFPSSPVEVSLSNTIILQDQTERMEH